MDEHYDAATAYAEQAQSVAGTLTQEAVSRLRAAEMDAPEAWPRSLSWKATNMGVLVETEHGMYVITEASELKPPEVLRRLLHPGWQTNQIPGWC